MLEEIRVYSYDRLGDSGMMLIASRSALEQLVAELNTALQDAPDKEARDWPRELCALTTSYPDGRPGSYAVTFHLETVSGAEPALPEYSRLPGKLQLLLWLLALIGLASIVFWLLPLF